MSRQLRKVTCIIILVLLLTMSTSVLAYTQEGINGYLNKSGSLVQYSTVRTVTNHAKVQVNIGFPTGTFLRLGLRNPSTGVQFTNSMQWDFPIYLYRSFTLTSNGSTTIPSGTRFAFNGRMGPTYNAWQSNWWSGSVRY